MNLWKFNQSLLPSGGVALSSKEDKNEEDDVRGEDEEARSGGGGSHPATGADHAEPEVFIFIVQPPFFFQLCCPLLLCLTIRFDLITFAV